MKLGIPVWQSRVSPVFDSARSLLVIEIEGGREVARNEATLSEVFAADRAVRVAGLGVDILVCGAISRPLAEMLFAHGVEVIPWISAGVEEALAAYLTGSLMEEAFLMPGCCPRRRRRRQGRLRRRGGQGGRSYSMGTVREERG